MICAFLLSRTGLRHCARGFKLRMMHKYFVDTMQRMKEGGIKGILNFSPAILGDKDIAVRNVHFAEELRFLTAMIPDLEKGV